MGSENENEISDHLRKDPAVALDEGDFLIPGKRSSASSSSSSDSSDSSIEDLFQVDVNEQPESTSLDIGFPELVSGDVNEKPKSTTLDIGSPELAADIESASIDVDKDDSGNSSPKSEKSVEESAGPSLPAEVPSLIPDSILHSELPMQSPPVQLMGRSEDYNPFRIPPSVFERSKSTTPMEWSVASNESLFSIHVGNNSFSRDHVFLLGRSGELGNSGELTKSDEFINFPMSPPEAAAAAAKEEDLGITELKHGTKKSHRFYVESRSGSLYCQICDDLVWDPTLEELRVRKIGTGSFTGRKRKHDELFSDSIKDDPRFISSNTTVASCRANGLRGIYNAGATCYQNVVLQSFLHNPLLRNFYLSDGHQDNDCQVSHCLSCAMDDMFQDFYALENTNGYTAATILSGFWISEKKAFENLVTTKEQDAHEFFQFLAEELHERNGDGKKPEIGSEHSCNCVIHQTFYGKMQTTTTCQNCNGTSSSVQSFLDLSLGLDHVVQKRIKKTGQKKPSLTLKDCLDEEYIKSDKCEYRCNHCNSTQQAKRNARIKRLPNVLSIQLKRFEYRQGRHDRAASKIDNEVRFPLQLNMLPYTHRVRNRDSRENLELERSCTYDLLSVVVHVGEIETGHYVSYCRVGDQWFKFNDHKVELASVSDVLGAQAYLLFYIIRSLA